MTAPPSALILGCAGKELTDGERDFYRDTDPLGFILFARNCESPGQVRDLVADFRGVVGRDDAPVLIDQEGGRVQRLKPPHWRDAPPAQVFARLYESDRQAGCEAAYLNALLIARDLADLGITVDCAPVLDVPQPDAHDIIGDRAYGQTPGPVAELGRAVCDGLLAGGVLPVIKHLPGHGRALADSHLELPVVKASRGDLETIDFPPFMELADMPWAMTAHVVYAAFDEATPATTSATMIDEVIRRHFGFDGLLLSDDIGMEALAGDFEDRTSRSLDAGCDIALHCSGDMNEMVAAARGARPLGDEAMARVARGESLRQNCSADPATSEAALQRLQDLIGAAP